MAHRMLACQGECLREFSCEVFKKELHTSKEQIKKIEPGMDRLNSDLRRNECFLSFRKEGGEKIMVQ
jgi:hypothetical protein